MSCVARRIKETNLLTALRPIHRDPLICHNFPNHESSGCDRREIWIRQVYLNLDSAGQGSVYLDECIDVWYDSDLEGHQEDDDEMIGELRAVKEIRKPQGHAGWTKELFRELYNFAFFADCKASSTISRKSVPTKS